MVNNKKTKSSTKATKAAIQKAVVTGPTMDPNPKLPALGSSITAPQFTVLCMLGTGVMYLREISSALTHRGACRRYLLQWEDDCTNPDMFMIQQKFNSGLFSFILVAFCAVLCWKDKPLMNRFSVLLCSGPVSATLLAMQSTKHLVHPKTLLQLGLLVTILLITAAMSLYYSNAPIAMRHAIKVDLVHATLLTLSVAHVWEVYKFLSAGVAGYLAIAEPSHDASPTSIALLPYLAVDQATIVTVCFFAAMYWKESKQRTLLCFIAILQALSLIFQFPKVKPALRDGSYYENFYQGTIAFCITAAFAPQVTLFTEPRPDVDDDDEKVDVKAE